MKKTTASIIIISALLTACGGSGSSSNSTNESNTAGASTQNQTSTQQRDITGVYFGKTSQNNTLNLILTDDKTYLGIYNNDNDDIQGIIQGDYTISNNSLTSSNTVDFNISGTENISKVEATVDPKKTVNFEATYLPSQIVTGNLKYGSEVSDKKISLTDVQGSYTGIAAIVGDGEEDLTFSISSNGSFSAKTDSGCTFTGEITNQNQFYVKISGQFGGSPCTLANQKAAGLGFYDADNKAFTSALINSNRSKGITFGGQR